MERKEILITGGAGYIGSHTLVELYNSGYTPIVVDNLSNSSINNIRGAEEIIKNKIDFYQVDCTDFDQMDRLFKEQNNIVAVIHFAAYKSVEESLIKPNKYFSNNIGSLENLLELMNKHRVHNLIFSSSCTVYGNPKLLPVNELEPFGKAESPYAETKQLCEKLIEESKINSISLRYFNPVGSHSSGLIGDCSADKPNNLVPIICEVASGKRKSMQIFGNDYKTHDGTCVRDYIHVVDLAKAHTMALNHILNNTKIKTAFNLGAGKGVSVLEVIDSFEKVNELKISHEIGP